MKLTIFGLSLVGLIASTLYYNQDLAADSSEPRHFLASQKSLEPDIQEYRNRQDQATPLSVLEWLKEGNERFASGRSTHGGYPIDARHRRLVTATGQRPLAVVLSCIDSRTSPELTFDVAPGDLFTVRVGANVVNDDILGSIEIAAESGAKIVVVLGHTDCGGVKGACNNIDFGHFTQLANRVKPALSRTHLRLDADPGLANFVGERVVSNRRYITEVSHDNARQSAEQLLERSEILRSKVASGEILLVSSLYDVDSGLVTFDTVTAPLSRHKR